MLLNWVEKSKSFCRKDTQQTGNYFLPYEGMQEQYLYLEKFPFLLPVAWIQRIFRTIVWRKDKITSTLQSTNIEQDRLEKVKKVMDALELFESD